MSQFILTKSLPQFEDIKKTVLLTHKNCSDGSGCAIMFMEAGGLKNNILFSSAGAVSKAIEDFNLINDSRFLVIADLGYQPGDNFELLNKRGNFVILDHHKTSIGLKDHDCCCIEMGACGTELLRQYLGLENDWCKRYASDVDDIDRWVRKNLPISSNLVEYHGFLGQQIFIEKFTVQNDLFQRSLLEGWLTINEKSVVDVLIRKKEEHNLEALEKVVILPVAVDFSDKLVKFGYTTFKGNDELAEMMLNKFPEISAACFFNLETKSVSLRSRKGEFDVAKFSNEFYAGGGHAQSAGHRFSDQLILDLLEGIH